MEWLRVLYCPVHIKSSLRPGTYEYRTSQFLVPTMIPNYYGTYSKVPYCYSTVLVQYSTVESQSRGQSNIQMSP